MTDCITGLYAAFGAVMALLHRKESGKGQLIDAALYECAFSFMEPHVPAYDKLGFIANRAGSRLPDSTPNNLYPTRDHSYIHITAMGEGNLVAERRRGLARRATLLRAAEIYGERFARPSGRVTASFEVLFLHGWAPHASQPKPLKPGSAARRLAEALDTAEHSAGEKVERS